MNGVTVPRKRLRTQKQPAQRKRKRQSQITNLPVELLTMALAQIAMYLSPPDILSLARSNGIFRDILMSRSSRYIWLNAMRNAEGLPPCPSGMSEPRYVALLYTNNCSSCGTSTRAQVDEFLLARLCGSCFHDDLVRLHHLPDELYGLVCYSTKDFGAYSVLPEFRYNPLIGVADRTEAEVVYEKYKELVEGDDIDQEAFDAWIEHRKRQVIRRRELAKRLIEFLIGLEHKRRDEKEELANKRQAQIEERLLALGWEKGDFKCNPYSGGRAKDWYELFEMPKQPKLLTDRTWNNLYTKLYPLLEVNREERLALKAAQVKVTRLQCLDRFLLRVKREKPPLLKVKPRKPVPVGYDSSSQPLVCRDVFPFPQDALEWTCIHNMDEEELDDEGFEQVLEEHRAEIDASITEWQDATRTYLVNRLKEEDMEYPELLQPPNNMDPRTFARLSEDQKLLLRADSLFYVAHIYSSNGTCRPLPYDRALRNLYPSCPDYPEELWEMDRYSDPEAFDLDHIRRYGGAQKVARNLLNDLGKPNASYLEVNQLRYVCQRCHTNEPMDWSGIVEHYIEQRQIKAKVKKYALTLAQLGIKYNNLHDPGSTPMIRPCKPKKSIKVAVRTCSLCSKKPIDYNLTAPKTSLYKHLLEVHGVKKPKMDAHYHLPSSHKRWERPGVGYDYFDEDEGEIEEVEVDNRPRKKGVKEEEYIYEGEVAYYDSGDENVGEILCDNMFDSKGVENEW